MSDNFTKVLAMLAAGGRIDIEQDGFHGNDLVLHGPAPQLEGGTVDRLMREGWLESTSNGGSYVLSAARRKDYADRPTGAHTQAVTDVLAECRRQVEVEGWTPEHDDDHQLGELASAGACYAIAAHMQIGGSDLPDPAGGFVTDWWPWSLDWWKPKNPRRDLVRAAALLIKEIERLDRAAIAKATTP